MLINMKRQYDIMILTSNSSICTQIFLQWEKKIGNWLRDSRQTYLLIQYRGRSYCLEMLVSLYMDSLAEKIESELLTIVVL